MPLPEDVVADDPRYASEHPSHHNQIHAAINDLEALAGTLSDVETTTGSQGKVDTHALDTTSVHGISDTAQVAFKNAAQTFTQDQRIKNVIVKEHPTDVRHPDFGTVDLTGVADSTTALQAAIDATPENGILFFPPGFYKISSLTFSDPITVRGSGWKQRFADPFGTSNYTAASPNMAGTILVSTVTSGRALLFDNASEVVGYNVQDICVRGPGSGTSIGIEVAVGTQQSFFQHVGVCNFSVGFDMYGQECAFHSLEARGCKTGLKFRDNNNLFTNIEVQYSDTVGIELPEGSVNTFMGGLLQNITAGDGVKTVTGSNSNTFTGFHCENASTGPSKWFNMVGTNHAIINTWVNIPASPGPSIYFPDSYCKAIGIRGALVGTTTVEFSNVALGGFACSVNGNVVDPDGVNTVLGAEGDWSGSSGPTFRTWRLRTAQGIGTSHVAAATPTGGASGDMKLGNSKIWVNDAGTWKSVAVA